MKIEDPIREVHWSREEEIDYAKENGIPVPITKKSPYSIDENLWGRANECGILENPWNSAPKDAYARTNALEDTPNEADVITLTFENGVPVKLNDEALQLDVLIQNSTSWPANTESVESITLKTVSLASNHAKSTNVLLLPF